MKKSEKRVTVRAINGISVIKVIGYQAVTNIRDLKRMIKDSTLYDAKRIALSDIEHIIDVLIGIAKVAEDIEEKLIKKVIERED